MTLFGMILMGLAAPGSAARAEEFSHDRWDKLLKANVTAEGWVNYENLRGKDAAELKSYLKELEKADPATLGGKDAQKAFWINAYNAICVKTLIDAGLPAEVPHAKLFGRNIFTERTYEVAGKVRSLDDIEHGILRQDFPDPRLHSAVVCGASSCPRLRPEAFAADRLEKQLDEECASWVAVEKNKKAERKNYLDAKTATYHASKIFYWYEADFGGAEGGLKFLKKYASGADRAFLEKHKVRLKYLDYDWALNRQGDGR